MGFKETFAMLLAALTLPVFAVSWFSDSPQDYAITPETSFEFFSTLERDFYNSEPKRLAYEPPPQARDRLEKRQTVNASFVCSAANDNSNSFPCTVDYDCYFFDGLRNGYSYYTMRSPFGYSTERFRFQCLNNRCVRVVKSKEGESCDNMGQTESFPPGQT
jgi:hypothetical protein